MGVAVILGVVSAVLYGTTDFLARFAGRRVGPLRTLLWGHGSAAGVLSCIVLATGAPSASGSVWALAVLANTILLAATALLYRAMAVGRLAVVAPIVAAYGGVSAALSWISGEPLRPMGALALGLILAGGVLTAWPASADDARGPSAGVGAASASALAYGVGFWLQGRFVAPRLGALVPVWCYYLEGATATALIAAATRASAAPPRGRDLLAVLALTGMACLGTLALTAGEALGQVAVVTVMSGACCAVTVLLARVVLKEAVGLAGWGGVALTVAGVGLLRLP